MGSSDAQNTFTRVKPSGAHEPIHRPIGLCHEGPDVHARLDTGSRAARVPLEHDHSAARQGALSSQQKTMASRVFSVSDFATEHLKACEESNRGHFPQG